jgi:hypothetical protein
MTALEHEAVALAQKLVAMGRRRDTEYASWHSIPGWEIGALLSHARVIVHMAEHPDQEDA